MCVGILHETAEFEGKAFFGAKKFVFIFETLKREKKRYFIL